MNCWPDIYDAVDNMPGRYTYLGGSTTGGAVVYDGGKFLYSHHATHPCGGKLVNAFDLVRLHLFGDRDDGAVAGTPTNRMPSYMAMCNYALGLPDVSARMAQEDFAGVADDGQEPENNLEWTKHLTRDEKGNYHKTMEITYR